VSLLLICSDRVHSDFRARPARGSLFFACTKKSNQKKCTPGAAPSALCAAGAQGQAGVRSMGILPIRELARIPARDPAGDSVLPSPRLTGPRIKSSQAKAASLLPFASCFCAQDARALLLPGPHGLAAAADEKAPQGCARGIARIPLLHRMCNQRNPADDADRSGRSPNGARRWGVFLCLPSLHKQRK